ncbi:Uncharacterised protein, partial [Mycoplasma putrefaciens]
MKEYIIAKLEKIDQNYLYLLKDDVCYKFYYSKNDAKQLKLNDQLKLYISTIW